MRGWSVHPPLPVLDGALSPRPWEWLPWDWEAERPRSDRELFHHQVTGSQYALDQWGGALFMGMRTGKSLTLVETILQGGIFPHLIVCPVSVMATWETEFLSEGLRPEEIQLVRKGGRADQLVRPGALVVVVNFEVVKKTRALRLRSTLPRALEIPDWAGITVDESFRIANSEASVTAEILRSPRPFGQFRAILSGSPASESGLNLASQFLFLEGEFMGCRSMVSYLRRFCRQDPSTRRWAPSQVSHLQEIRDMVQARAYCLQMTDLDLGVEKVLTVWDVEPTKAQAEALQWCKLANTYMGVDKDGAPAVKLMEPLVRSTFLSKASAGVDPRTNEIVGDGKVRLLLQWLEEHPDESALVLSRFTLPIHHAAQLLQEAGVSVAVIWGATSQAERERIRVAFQAGEIRVVVGQVKTVKMGMDFSRANYLFYLSNSYSQDDRIQSEERGNHTKKTGVLQVVDLCTKGGNDRDLVRLLTSKKRLSQSYIAETLGKWAAELGTA